MPRNASLPWFRMYHEARNDAKLRTLSVEQRWVWFCLLCYAAEQPTRGTIQDCSSELLAAEVADGDEELLNATVDKLVRLRILSVDAEAGTIMFRKFEERQYDKPSDAPEATRERKRRQRERDPHSTAQCVTTESREVTPGHAIDTDLDTDTDLEREREENVPGPRVPAPVIADTPYALYCSLLEEIGTEEREVGAKFKGKQLGLAKTLLQDGFGEDKVRRYIRYLLAEEWRTSPIDLGTVAKGIATWEANGSPALPRTRASPNGRARASPDYSGIDEFSRRMDALEAKGGLGGTRDF